MNNFSAFKALATSLGAALLAAGTTTAGGLSPVNAAIIGSETGAAPNNTPNNPPNNPPNNRTIANPNANSNNGDMPNRADVLLLSHSSVYHIVEETIFDLLELPESMVTQDAKLQDLFAEARVCDRQDTAQTTIRLLGILFEEFQVDLENEAVLADLNQVETVGELSDLVLKYGTY